ncbi:MAG TPA: hypothetical protein VFD32_10750 [Dehalococcoidia bacterium]|nr:hypothetical protein [Dehalococcoidia bacterium]
MPCAAPCPRLRTHPRRPAVWFVLALLLFALLATTARLGGLRRGVAAGQTGGLALGGALAYISGGDVWLVVDGAPATQLTHDGGATRIRFTPGGTALLVQERDRLFVLRPDGTPLPLGPGAWLPDDTGVATVDGDALILRAPDGSLLRTLVAARAQVGLQPVAWSPDGATLAFNRLTVDSRGIPVDQSVWLVGRDGGSLRELIPPADTWPQALGWSPDGRWLAVFRGPAEACVSCRVDGQELDAVAVGDGRALVAGTVVRPDGYCFTADGSALIASAGAGRESYRDKQVIRLDLQSGAVAALAGGGSSVAIQPACAPRGSSVAFTLGPALRGEPFSDLDPAHGYPQALLSGRRLRTGGAAGDAGAPPSGYAQEAPRWTSPDTLLYVQWAVGSDAEPTDASLWLESSDGSAAREIVPALGTTAPPAPYFGDDGFADLFDWHP